EPEAVDVVHVQQPVHAVDLVGAVGAAQLVGDRVLADRDPVVERRRVAVRVRLLGDVGRRGVRVVGAVGGLVGGAGDDEGLHRLPGVVQRFPVTGDPTVVGL